MTETTDQPVDQTPARREPRPQQFTAGGPLAAMIPQTAEEYARMASLLIDAECVPDSYRSKADGEQGYRETRAKLIIGLMKSVEIGVPPLTGINGIMIINNRPSVWGDLGVALIQRDGHLEKMEVRRFGPDPHPGMQLNDWAREFGYRVTMWRRGQELPYIGEFTVDAARRASLWENTKRAPWIYYPHDMLFNRARAKAMRAGFADSLHGMSIVEEARDVAPEPVKPSVGMILSDEPAAIEHQADDSTPIPAEEREKEEAKLI